MSSTLHVSIWSAMYGWGEAQSNHSIWSAMYGWGEAQSNHSASLAACNYQLSGFNVPSPYTSTPNNQITVVCGLPTHDDTVTRTMRLDPLLSKGKVFQHMHTVFGNINFGSEVTEADITLGTDKLAINTCNNPADGSIYWVPTMYKREGGVNHIVPVSLSVYYKDNNKCTGQNTPLSNMPVGLRIVVGDAHRSTPLQGGDSECGGDHIDWGDQVSGSLPGFPSEVYSRTGFWQANIYFPNCWDGKNLFNEDQSHMSYPTGDVCPGTHPVRIPKLLGEVHYHASHLGGSRDQFFLASRQGGVQDDYEGWTSHMDFIAGWNNEMLDAAIKTCPQDRWELSGCPFRQFMNPCPTGLCKPGVQTHPIHKQKPAEPVHGMPDNPHDQGAPIDGSSPAQFLCGGGGTPTPPPPSPSTTCASAQWGSCQPSPNTGSCKDHLLYAINDEGKACGEALNELHSQCGPCSACVESDCPSSPTPSPSPSPSAACQDHRGCSGLAGLCCPTVDGQMLYCCNQFNDFLV